MDSAAVKVVCFQFSTVRSALARATDKIVREVESIVALYSAVAAAGRQHRVHRAPLGDVMGNITFRRQQRFGH